MARGLQMLTGIVAAIAVFSIGTFFYLTREITVPSAEHVFSIQTVATPADTDAVTYSIRQSGTTAAYGLYEHSNGSGEIVAHITDQVSGEIVLNMTDLSRSQFDVVAIMTDNAIMHFAVQSDDNTDTLIRFETTTISGFSGNAGVGDTLNFQASGDLTIAGVTQCATFDVTVNLQSADELTGHAETVISRTDFDLTVPAGSSAAVIDDAVTLKLDFVASAE